MKVTILGTGAWGGAFAKVLQRNGHEVHALRRQDMAWPEGGPGELIFLAVPCQALRSRLGELPVPNVPVVSLIKGLEANTHLRVSEVVEQVWPGTPFAVVSGPSFAAEVQINAPSAVVAASPDTDLLIKVQEAVHQKLFRVYRSSDLLGVELGGALKNIYAITGGICEGLGFGENGMAGLMTRSLAEMVRVACSQGAKKETLFGLSGMGDLILTAYSGQSRNHQTGVALGKGRELEEILSHLGGVAEGVPTTKAVYQIVEELGIKAPVVRELYKVLYEGLPAAKGFENLMLRSVDEE